MAYEIQFITDSRDGGTKEQLEEMDREIKDSLKNLPGVKLETIRHIYHITFENGATEQWRITYRVSKTSRDTSWNDIMGKINKIQAPFYKRV